MNDKARKIALIVFSCLIGVIFIFFGILMFNLTPKNANDEKMVIFEIEEGTGKSMIVENLYDANLIKNSFFLKIYMYFDDPVLYAGTYELSPSMSALEIMELIENGKSLENETIDLTFIEGKRLSTYVKQISDAFGYSEEEIFNVLEDSDFKNSLMEKYWFIDNSILNKDIYYSLEGYIYPDTYSFKQISSIEEIIFKTLDNMNNKLSEYKDEIELSGYSTHELLTLASIVELEGANSTDRAGVAGVFYNRINSGWTLGSDVTTYYAVSKDFSVDLTQVDLNSCNGYNTRGSCVKGLPVGPICSSSLESIVSVIVPKKHDYYYFVADINKNTYFSKSGVEHDETVAKLKKEGKWYEY